MKPLALLCVIALGMAGGLSQAGKAPERYSIESLDNPLWPVKAGVSSVATGIQVRVSDASNRLTIGGKVWTGRDSRQPEVAVIYEGQVYHPQDLPQGFNLEQAILVSFEQDKVRIVNFPRMRAGFYPRPEFEPSLSAGAAIASCAGRKQCHAPVIETLDEQWWPVKGGVAPLGDDSYVFVSSEKNTLDIHDKEWMGRNRSLPEIAFVYRGGVIQEDALPEAFNLAEVMLISFEAEKVRIVDFPDMRAGYFPRPAL